MRNYREYKGLIWTNHALERLEDRGLSQDYAFQTFKYPDQKFDGKKDGTQEFTKRFGPSLVTVIAMQNEKKEWIVLSNWVDPPLPGSIDSKKNEFYKKYKKASFWGKFWLILKRQIGF